MPRRPEIRQTDPFDLPEWLGTAAATWETSTGIAGRHHVGGELTGPGDRIPCDLLAADQAYPSPVLGESWRRAAHQAWHHGQVLVLEYDGRLTLAVPGTSFSADLVLETLGRLAKAVGSTPSAFSAVLRV